MQGTGASPEDQSGCGTSVYVSARRSFSPRHFLMVAATKPSHTSTPLSMQSQSFPNNCSINLKSNLFLKMKRAQCFLEQRKLLMTSSATGLLWDEMNSLHWIWSTSDLTLFIQSKKQMFRCKRNVLQCSLAPTNPSAVHLWSKYSEV